MVQHFHPLAPHPTIASQSDTQDPKVVMQLVASASTAAAEAQAAADRCQQQVLELRGRLGQAERRLDTVWQTQVGLWGCVHHH
jgi:hypothetical protein